MKVDTGMTPSGVRLAELVALLSLGTDLGLGQPMEHMIRTCLVAFRLADRLGLDESERPVLYYSGLLAWVGCHTDAYEQAKWMGDDIVPRAEAHYEFDFGRASDANAFMLRNIGGASRPLMSRLRVGMGFVRSRGEALQQLGENHYAATDQLAQRLGLGAQVRHALGQSYERWDGLGPAGLRGEEIALSSRLVNLADVVEVYHRTYGVDAAVAVAEDRAGTHFDPELVRLFCAAPNDYLVGADAPDSWSDLLDRELHVDDELTDKELDDALHAIGVFAELKSPWRLGHSPAVADLATNAAKILGLAPLDQLLVRRAALVHDIGVLGVSNSIWDKQEPLSKAEVERIRLHPYLGARMLSFTKVLEPLAVIVAQHHERLDGSGYPNGIGGDAISRHARILAAADVYSALTEMRPHRDALSPEEAAEVLRQEVRDGRIDAHAANAVLDAAGQRTGKKGVWPDGLTDREVEVLRLVARGLTNKEVAAKLFISPKTVGNHIEHIYQKIGVSNRAMAGVYAAKHGLMVEFGH